MWEAGFPVLCLDYFPDSNDPHCADVLDLPLGSASIIEQLVKCTVEIVQCCCVGDTLHCHGESDGKGPLLLLRL